jgi:hypothetical protein
VRRPSAPPLDFSYTATKARVPHSSRLLRRVGWTLLAQQHSHKSSSAHPSCLLRRVGWRVLAQQQRHKSGAHLRDSLIVAKVGIVRNATVFFVPTIGSKLQAEVPITPIPGNFGPIGRVGDHAGRVLFACEREPIGRGAGRARHRYNCLQNIAIEHFGAARGRKVDAKTQLFR